MDIRPSSPKDELSPSDSVSDPEGKEISDDDDDRNHKHRRRETLSQSLERDSLEQVLARSHRNQSKPFKNGNHVRGADYHSNGTWKNNNSPLEQDFSGKFDRRHPGMAQVSRAPFDLNERIRVNQSWCGDPGSGRGRGRNASFWSERDSRFSSADFTAQMVQQGPGHGAASLFAWRGMPSVSNTQSASWNAFTLVPGLPNGGLDTLHSLGLQRPLRAPINHSMGVSDPRQRCRDFDELGFCMRGDMCPLEHGVNRIIVEDVQSLSQFNLPVSLPNVHFLGAPAGPASLSALNAPSSTLTNEKCLFSKSGNSGVLDDGFGSNGDINGSSVADGADFYDPDQPLWSNDCSQTSTGLLLPVPAKANGALNQPSLTDDPGIGLYDGSDNEHPVTNTGTAVGSQSSSVWGRISSSKSTPGTKEKIDCRIVSSNHSGNLTREDQGLLDIAKGTTSHLGKVTNADNIGPYAPGSSLKNLSGTGRTIRKTSLKAQRTLFVNNIPQKNNKRDALLSHFWKFGEVINIYIPVNSERAFVQFSKREEAENALNAPDAVMGNRFIKLWWANRDNIPNDGINGGNGAGIASRVSRSEPVPNCPAVFSRGGDVPEAAAALNGNTIHASVSPGLASDNLKPVVINSSLAPTKKKVETLELLKEEIRKKQEMLDQKRNDFRRKLDQLEKQATGVKGEVKVEQTAKRQRVGIVADATKPATPTLVIPSTVIASSRAEMSSDISRSGENICSPNIGTMVELEEPSSLKRSIRPLAPAGAPYVMNRFKLDNRPTTFKILPPLPSGLANVDALKEHFSTYGELSSVDLEDLELEGGGDELMPPKTSARIDFATRHSAEKAFSNGKCWKGQYMQFTWLTCNNSSRGSSGKENPSSCSSKVSADANGLTAGEVVSTGSEKTTISREMKSESSERKESGGEHMLPDEEFDSNLSAMPSQKKSPGYDACSE